VLTGTIAFPDFQAAMTAARSSGPCGNEIIIACGCSRAPGKNLATAGAHSSINRASGMRAAPEVAEVTRRPLRQDDASLATRSLLGNRLATMHSSWTGARSTERIR
jgi:hypothetical protein